MEYEQLKLDGLSTLASTTEKPRLKNSKEKSRNIHQELESLTRMGGQEMAYLIAELASLCGTLEETYKVPRELISKVTKRAMELSKTTLNMAKNRDFIDGVLAELGEEK